MSVINAYPSVVAPDPGRGTADSRPASDLPAPGEPVAIDEFIAHVLGRAHQTAEAVHGPDEARAILHVALLFARELAKTNPQFDRLQFIEAITRGPA